MSILEVNLPTMSLVGSVTATSYVLFSHIGLSQYGPIPLLRGTLAPDVQLRPSDKVKAWAAFYEAGKNLTLGATALNVIFCGITAFTHPSNQISKIAVASAAVGLTIVPYTLSVIMPINKELMGIAENINVDALPDTADGRRVDELVTRWDALHKVRFLSYAGAWVLSMLALVADTRLIVDVVDVVYNVGKGV